MVKLFIDEDILQEFSAFCLLRGWAVYPGDLYSGRLECKLMIDSRRIQSQNSGLPPLQDLFEIGYELCRMQEKRVTRDIIEYVNRWIPPYIHVDGLTYQFQMFPNHPHYDFRFCFDAGIDDNGLSRFKYLVENISNDRDLLQDLQWLRTQLMVDNMLDGDYKTPEGYTKQKYQEWLNKSK